MKKIFLYLIILGIMLMLAGCSKEDYSEKCAERDVFAMDTYMSIKAYGEECEEAVDEAVEEILRLDALLSTGSADSEITMVNQNHGGDLSDDTAYLVSRSLDIYQATSGAFDISIYPVMQAWGFAGDTFRVPENQELEQLLENVNAGNILYDDNTRKIAFASDEMAIDLGGIAKGYTSTRIMDIFKSYKVDCGLVNLGGNVQVYGSKSDGTAWHVAVQDPENQAEYIGTLSVVDKAVITSGGYERYFEEDGIIYHHIIDPATGYPAASGLKSVTIVSADGTLADGLSTSLFIMGLDRSIEYWKEHSDEFDVILVTDDRDIYVSENIAKDFSAQKDFFVITKEGED